MYFVENDDTKLNGKKTIVFVRNMKKRYYK